MDGSVGTVNHQVNPSLRLKHGTIPLEASKPRAEPPKLVTGVSHSRSVEGKERALKAFEEANVIAQFLDRKISFSYDERIDRVIVKIVRESTGELVRQIPPEEMVDLMAKLRDDFRGIIFNRTG